MVTFGEEIYIHFVAQETSIVKKIFFLNIFIEKGQSKFDNQNYISLSISTFLMEKFKMNNFLICL